MKQLKKITLTVAALLSLASAESMKITFNGSTKNVNLTAISSWVFSGGSLNLTGGEGFTIADIKKIEFVDGSTPIVDGVNYNGTREELRAMVSSDRISLTIPVNQEITVSLYSVNGRKVAQLYSGFSQSGTVDIQRSGLSLASGIYSLVVSGGSEILLQKIAL